MHGAFSPIRPTLLAAALALSFPLHAQEVPQQTGKASGEATPQPAQKMQTVEVKGTAAAYDPRRDDTATKIVVSQEEIVKYGDTSVTDVLKRVPGITVNSSNGRGGEIRMRGLGAGYTQILINGERAPAGFSIESLSPDVIERIEVLRAASAEFSTQSVAGTINIVLKKAIRSGQRELKLGMRRTSSGMGGPNANLQLSDKAGRMSYSISGAAAHESFERTATVTEDAFAGNGLQTQARSTTGREDGSFTFVNLAPRLNWNLENGDTLSSQTFLNMARFETRTNEVASTGIGTPAAYPELDLANEVKNSYLRTELNWVHKMEDGAKLDTKLGAHSGENDNDQRRWTPAGAARALDNVIASSSEDRGVTSTGKYSKTIFEGHALGMGWDGGYNTREETRLEREGGSLVFPGLPDGEQFESQVSRLALYAQDEWSLSPRLSVYLGARWEGIRTRTSGNTFETGRSRSSVWSPVLQTLWKIPETKGDQLRFAVTRTYKAPGVQNLIPRRQTSVDNRSTDPDYQGNPNLQPELALGFDLSYEHYWAEGALLSASVSSRRIDGYTRHLIDFDGARWVAMPMNAGRAETRGLELEAKLPLKAIVDGAPAIDLRASLSRNWSEVEDVPGPDNRLDGQTPLSANLGIDYKTGSFTTGASFAYKQGGVVRVSERQTSTLETRRDLEAYVLYKFSPKLQLRVAGQNLLDQDFTSRTSYLEDGRGLVLRRGEYPVGVTLRATVEAKF